jgi:hypothetical protein
MVSRLKSIPIGASGGPITLLRYVNKLTFTSYTPRNKIALLIDLL